MRGTMRDAIFKIKKQILKLLQSRIDHRNRKRLIPKSRTIISNNCTAGYMYHNLGLRFESPTINLFIEPQDYSKMIRDFDKYFDPAAEIIEIKGIKDYPVGEIYGCKVYFMHYPIFEEAVGKWRERCKRINKVVFSHLLPLNVRSVFYIRGFEKTSCVGNLQEKMNWTGKRYIDQFDYVEFLNKGST